MEASSSLPGTPAGGPLQTVSPERVNRRDSLFSSVRGDGGRDSAVHEKINQFNNLSIAMQSKQMERKTVDAALKRAMVGREEAEAELRRLREESKLLRKTVEEGTERERRVGERLEAIMENYGRAKETHAHTQALWEKEIRRYRKENFKSQSAIVKLQEELKSARSSVKGVEESLQREKERSKAREQEAFTARYQIVGVQEQLDKALEHIKVVEQERDAFKTAAKNEEVARIAAEGRLPLPQSQDASDEFDSPKKKKKTGLTQKQRGKQASRVSLSTMEITSSAASEMEIEELTTQVLWERQRAERAQEMLEFLQAECQMHCCHGSKTKNARNSPDAPQKRRRISVETEELDAVVIKDEPQSPGEPLHRSSRSREHEPQDECEPQPEQNIEPETELETEPGPELELEAEPEPQRVKSRKEPRRSTIFCLKEGIFRTVSEQEAAAFEAQQEFEANIEPVIYEDADEPRPSTEHSDREVEEFVDEAQHNPRNFARTPSVDPPAFALLAQERDSLDSLLNAPHDDTISVPLPKIPSVPVVADVLPTEEPQRGLSPDGSPPRPHTSTASYTVTTQVPLRDERSRSSSSLNERLRTPSHGSNASFDMNDPAMTPTMTREQALAKIRERRGRARSAAQSSAATPAKKAPVKSGRPIKRDMSAPTAKANGRVRS